MVGAASVGRCLGRAGRQRGRRAGGGDLICDTSCLYLQMVSIAPGGGLCGDVSGLSPFVCVNEVHKGARTRKLAHIVMEASPGWTVPLF